MAMSNLSSLGPFAEELLDNRYARENLREGAEKLRDAYNGRRKPKRTGRKLLLGAAALGVAGLGVAIALNEELRDSLLGSAKALGEEIASKDGAGS